MSRLADALLIALAAVLATACGGGGGSPSGPPPSVDVSAVAAADPGSALPATWKEGPFAEIFVRSYQDSNGDGIGDLRGLIQRLDYLKDLGVTGVWLMPVNPSFDGDHGYAVNDYRAIEPQYGTLADFDELLREAHARGIGVIVDYVMNHSAAQNPLFLNSLSDNGNAYRDWYVWQGSRPSGWNVFGGNPWHDGGTKGGTGWYYGAFWGEMPDFNLRNAAAVRYHHDNLRFWLNRGVDGFRFDAVGNLVESGPSQWKNQPENYTLMSDVRGVVGGYANRFMVCEAPDDSFGFNTACGSAFAFGHQYEVVNAARGQTAAIQKVADYFKTASASASTMVSNHDAFAGQRLYDQVGGDLAQYRLAAATYLLLPGTPFIYYGEEIGMAGAASLGGDPKLRTPMSWTAAGGFSTGAPYRAPAANVGGFNVAAQQAAADSLLAHYKTLIALRKSQPALARGSYTSSAASGSVMSFQRVLGSERALVLINYGSAAATVNVASLPAGATLSRAFPAGGADLSTDAAGSASVNMPAQSVAVFTQR
jgi:alpha-amylase